MLPDTTHEDQENHCIVTAGIKNVGEKYDKKLSTIGRFLPEFRGNVKNKVFAI